MIFTFTFKSQSKSENISTVVIRKGAVLALIFYFVVAKKTHTNITFCYALKGLL